MVDDHENFDVARSIEQGLREMMAHRRGEVALETVTYDLMPAERVKAIRKAAGDTPLKFARRFGIPARTLEGWEQGRRKPDVAARVLLTVIEREPEAVERALKADAKR